MMKKFYQYVLSSLMQDGLTRQSSEGEMSNLLKCHKQGRGSWNKKEGYMWHALWNIIKY